MLMTSHIELQQPCSTEVQPLGERAPSPRWKSRDSEPLAGPPHSSLFTASCKHKQGRPLPKSPDLGAVKRLPTHCLVLPGKLAALLLWEGTEVALMADWVASGRSGLRSVTASPAPSSCLCCLDEHHGLNSSALRNPFSWHR